MGMPETWLTDLKRQDKESKLSPYTLNKHVKDFRASGRTQMRARLASEAFALLQMAEKGDAEGGGDLPATVFTSASPFDFGDWSKLLVCKAGGSPVQQTAAAVGSLKEFEGSILFGFNLSNLLLFVFCPRQSLWSKL